MQYVNDDMDDVFRRAAENYPLDTSGADWNKILTGLQGQSEAKPANKKDRRRYLWLLMLLPLGLVCNYYYDRGKGITAVNTSPKTQHDNSVIEQKTGNSETVDNRRNKSEKTGDANPDPDASTILGSGENLTSKDVNVFNDNGKKRMVIKANYSPKQSNRAGKDDNLFTSKGNNDASNQLPTTGPEMNSKANSFTSFINHGKLALPAIAIHPSTQFQGVRNDPKTKNDPARKPQRFYLGLMGGIDKTTIESQKSSQAGFDYGMLVGYKIGRKWAVEAAAFMDKKYYYTEGKYFKNDGLYMPPNSWITDVNGSCRMWDLSIGGSYSLFQNNKSGLFVATGMSSYIMKEENYDYTYYYAGSGTSAVHSKTYYNESKDLFSIVNLSMGYTHRFGKITDLRVEPYMKIPVQGVGVGNLSMFSAGIHIGITGKLF